MHTTWPTADGRQRENSGGFFRQGSNVVRSEISAKVNLSPIYSCCFNQILYSQSLPTNLKIHFGNKENQARDNRRLRFTATTTIRKKHLKEHRYSVHIQELRARPFHSQPLIQNVTIHFFSRITSHVKLE